MSCGRGVRLFESVEYLVSLLRRNPDAGIANFEVQHDFAAGARLDLDVHIDVPLKSKLDRIVNQVDQDLTKPARVAAEQVVNTGGDIEQQFQALLAGLHCKRPYDPRNVFVEPEVDRVEFHFARLDLREIQYVINNHQQRIGGLHDHREILMLLVGQIGIERQFGHSQHTVHGRADLVGHVGQKFALGLAGSLCSFSQFPGLCNRNRQFAVCTFGLFFGFEQFGGAVLHALFECLVQGGQFPFCFLAYGDFIVEHPDLVPNGIAHAHETPRQNTQFVF